MELEIYCFVFWPKHLMFGSIWLLSSTFFSSCFQKNSFDKSAVHYPCNWVDSWRVKCLFKMSGKKPYTNIEDTLIRSNLIDYSTFKYVFSVIWMCNIGWPATSTKWIVFVISQTGSKCKQVRFVVWALSILILLRKHFIKILFIKIQKKSSHLWAGETRQWLSKWVST